MLISTPLGCKNIKMNLILDRIDFLSYVIVHKQRSEGTVAPSEPVVCVGKLDIDYE